MLTGAPIEVTALDALPAPEAATEAAPEAAAATPPMVEEAEPPAPPAADPPVAEKPVVAEPEVVAPVAPKQEAQVACERKGGTWMAVGKTKLSACVKTTRDAGKTCVRQSQCESQCLARSGTCALFKPMLGCNEVLQENGARVTLCVE